MLSELYKGEKKVCPRCKGYKYIRGQKVYANAVQLPNYKHNEQGLCFLCDGTGEAFYTEDNKVLKMVSKGKMNYIIEYSPKNGEKICVLTGFRDDSSCNDSRTVKDFTSEVKEEDFFPNMYEMVWSDWSKVADVIFEEYPNARPINVNKFDAYEYEEGVSGDCINFLIYYDEFGKPIKPFYTNPPYDVDIDDDSCKGIVMLKHDYVFGVSGTYIESEKMLYLGIKTLREFKYYEVSDIRCSESLIKEIANEEKTNPDIRMTMFSSFLDKDIKKIANVILKDLYSMVN